MFLLLILKKDYWISLRNQYTQFPKIKKNASDDGVTGIFAPSMGLFLG